MQKVPYTHLIQNKMLHLNSFMCSLRSEIKEQAILKSLSIF